MALGLRKGVLNCGGVRKADEVMPDGSIAPFAFTAMHDRLVQYGLCWIRGGGGPTESIIVIEDQDGIREESVKGKPEAEVDNKERPRQWTRAEVEAAGALHRLILKLPLQHSIVVQVFYGEWVAECWHQFNPERQRAIIRDLTYWSGRPKGVNARIVDANKARHTHVSGISPTRFMEVRDDGVRMLINLERRGR